VIDIGSVVNGKYQLARLLGDGGMGSVYEARHTVLGTRVAIKVLHPELARRTGLTERFLQEARVAAQIRSPHVVQVTDVDRTPEGHAYIVMELLEGEPLSGVLDRQRKLPVPTACEYTLQILVALEAAHALGVIHRDLKPENVFVTFSGGKPVLKLIDFGIAKARRTDPQQKNLTVAGVLMGTAEYMAPEQARSANTVDARADLYAVGVMLYEMIAGSRPVNGDDARVIALKVERGEVVPLVQAAPDVPREIAGLVHRAMAPNPDLRFATATDMRLALEKAMTAKRAVTGMNPAQAAVAPGPESRQVGTSPPAAAAASPPPVSPAQHAGGTGTAGGLGPAGGMGPGVEGEGPHTERAGPIATALTPPAPVYAGMAVPPAPYVEHRGRGGGTGRVLALIALPILIGAGVVMVLVATGTWSPMSGSSGDPTVQPATTPDAGIATIATTPTTQETTPPVPTIVPTLAPTNPANTRPGGTVGPHPSGSTHPPPKKEPDAGVQQPQGPPPLFPSAFPFPTAIPGLPSVFPPVFPPWPPPQQPGPGTGGGQGPTPAPTNSSSGSI
jgi:serine/threonine-protein kinase